MKRIVKTLFLFFAVSFNANAHYYIDKFPKFRFIVHEDVDYLPGCVLESTQYYYNAHRLFGEVVDIMDVIVSQYDAESAGDFLVNRASGGESKINFNFNRYYQGKFDTFESGGYSFIFNYEISKYSLRQKYPFIGMAIPKWFSEGLALYFASKWSINSKYNCKRVRDMGIYSAFAFDKLYVAESKMKPHKLFFKIKESNNRLPYLFCNFLHYYEKKYGEAAIQNAIEKYGDSLKNENLYFTPFSSFAKEAKKGKDELLQEWWESIDFSEVEYHDENIEKEILFKQSLQTDGESIYFFEHNGKRNSLRSSNFPNGSSSRYLGNVSLKEFNDIYIEKCEKGNESFEEEYIIEEKGVFDILRVKKTQEVLFNVDKGLKIEKAMVYDGVLYFSALDNGNGPYIFKYLEKSGFERLVEGRAPFIHKGELYFIGLYGEKRGLYRIDGDKKIYSVVDGEGALEGLSFRGELYKLIDSINGTQLVKIAEDEELYKKRSLDTFSFFRRYSLFSSYSHMARKGWTWRDWNIDRPFGISVTPCTIFNPKIYYSDNLGLLMRAKLQDWSFQFPNIRKLFKGDEMFFSIKVDHIVYYTLFSPWESLQNKNAYFHMAFRNNPYRQDSISAIVKINFRLYEETYLASELAMHLPNINRHGEVLETNFIFANLNRPFLILGSEAHEAREFTGRRLGDFKSMPKLIEIKLPHFRMGYRRGIHKKYFALHGFKEKEKSIYSTDIHGPKIKKYRSYAYLNSYFSREFEGFNIYDYSLGINKIDLLMNFYLIMDTGKRISFNGLKNFLVSGDAAFVLAPSSKINFHIFSKNFSVEVGAALIFKNNGSQGIGYSGKKVVIPSFEMGVDF